MKTRTNFLLSLLLSGAAGVTGAYAQKPQLAVLVVGMETPAKGDELAARWAYDLNRDSTYELLTKSKTVEDKRAELSTQLALGKPVDTTGIAKWGRDNGIALVQLVVQDTIGTSPMENIAKRVAWLVDCSTGKLSGRGTFRLRFPSPPYLEDKVNKISLVGVRGGTFEMGCKAGRDDKVKTCSDNHAQPFQSSVSVGNFKIGKYEVTQAQWYAVMKGTAIESPPGYYFPDRPTEMVSWYMALAFCNELSKKLGKTPVYGGFALGDVGADGSCAACGADAANVTVDASANGYRLPTSSEWEYAARGCEMGGCDNFLYSGSDDVQEVGWNGTAGGAAYATWTQPVGLLKPNGLGIYDMTGNVWEWCWDKWEVVNDSQRRVLRGSGFYHSAADGWPRLAARLTNPPSACYGDSGFRVVLP
ncbi:MAG: formylglycine-generating enzyme family protein [Prevotellaceae bacterium]|nr:formylglycine-generating enzyme family protein [Prevotellaceae bacterium]